MKIKGGSIDEQLSIYLLYYYLYNFNLDTDKDLSKLPDELVLFYLLFIFVYSNLNMTFVNKLSLSYCNNNDDFNKLIRKLLNKEEDFILKADEYQIYLLLFEYIINKNEISYEITKNIIDLNNLLKKYGIKTQSGDFRISIEYMKKYIFPTIKIIQNLINKNNINLPISSLNHNKNNIITINEEYPYIINNTECKRLRHELLSNSLKKMSINKSVKPRNTEYFLNFNKTSSLKSNIDNSKLKVMSYGGKKILKKYL